MRRALLALVAAVACGCSTPTEAPPPSARADDGARIVSLEQRSDRMLDLTVDSPAVGRRVPVRLLLPAGFDGAPGRRWPVLYLLHGCCDDYRSWTEQTDVEELTAPSDVLVVMPDGGAVGFYSDWLRGPAWETFHLVEMRQLLERGYRAGPQRAIAGLSMGGLGAIAYAARHPGVFRAAASFSGLLNTRTTYGGGPRGHQFRLIEGEGEDPLALWGDPDQQAAVWAAHNPHDLAPRLRGTTLFVSTGNGDPGPLDPPGSTADDAEQLTHAETAEFVDRLRALRIPATADLYGPGTHTWPYWQRGLHRSWPLLSRALGIG